MAVGVSELVGDAVAEAGDDAGEQHGGDGAGRRVVVAPGVAHEPVVASSELRVDPAGPVSGHEQGRPEAGVTAFGGPASMIGYSGCIALRDQPGKRPRRSEAGETLGIAEPAEDLGGEDLTHAGDRHDDLIRIGLEIQVTDAAIQQGDLFGDLQGNRRLAGDVSSQ